MILNVFTRPFLYKPTNTKRPLRLLCIIYGITSLLTINSSLAQNIRYVKPIAAGTGNGSSWANASADLQAMINASATNDQVWIAAGTYKPNRRADATGTITSADRNNSFLLKADVKIYGHFAGTETAISQRDFNNTANKTELSGDFNGDDVITGSGESLSITANAENAYHVVMSVGGVGTAELNGLTISGGNANNSISTINVNTTTIYHDYGGGLLNESSSPIVYKCVIQNNSATYGGGIFSYKSSPNISNCIITANASANEGGGMLNLFDCSIILTNCTISGNKSIKNGGGISSTVNCTINISNSTISDNYTSLGDGGGIATNSSSVTINGSTISGNKARYNGGGMYNSATSGSSISITNCTFTSNSAEQSGGAITNSASSPTLTGCSINNNTAAADGGGIYNYASASPTLHNCTINSNVSGVRGGGMYNNASSPKLFWCDISGNTVNPGKGGGGIYNDNGSSPVLHNCSIKGNFSKFIDLSEYGGGTGGGVRNTASSPAFYNCLFSGNHAVYYGGAIANESSSSPTIINCTIAGNKSDNGAGIYNTNSNPKIQNSIILGNVGSTNPGIYNTSASTPSIEYSLIQGETGGSNGNLNGTTVDPGTVFVNWIDPSISATPNTLGDYKLKTGSIPTPIDFGSNTLYMAIANRSGLDLAALTRGRNTSIDMGAYEYQGGGTIALPVTFGTLTAEIKNGLLFVNWTTLDEKNCDHYKVQLSKDGEKFFTIGEVKTLAPNGESNVLLQYSFQKNTASMAGLLALPAFLLLLISARGTRQRIFSLLAIIAMMSMLFNSCKKSEVLTSSNSQKMYVRILQVDKDGKQQLSKVVQVTQE